MRSGARSAMAGGPGPVGAVSAALRGDAWAGWRRMVVSTLLFGVILTLTLVLGQRINGDRIPVGWMGNGIQLGILLLAPARLRIRYAAVFFVVSALLGMGWGLAPGMAVGASIANAAEMGLAIALLSADREWITGGTERLRSWGRFALAVAVAPVAGAVLGAATIILTFDLPQVSTVIWGVARTWYINDAAALWVVTPILLRLRPSLVRGPVGPRRPRELVASLVLVAAVTAGVLVQSEPVPLTLLPALLVLLLFRHDVVGVIAGSAVVTTLVLGFTRAGLGPFAITDVGSVGGGQVEAMGFLAVLTFTMLLVAALQSERQRRGGQRDVHEGVYRMIAEESTDLVMVMNSTRGVVYASPAARGGRDNDDVRPFWEIDRVHPADRPAVAAASARMHAGAGEMSCVCRALNFDDEYRWFDVRVRLVQSPRDPRDALTVCVAREVTELMRRQEALERSNLELADQAGTDPLTGLPNRRRLDAVGRTALERAVADSGPLSLLIVDVDRFKAYNDRLGHQAGDQCLIRVAQLIQQEVRRPSDLVARFGGEEFVVLLPHTDHTGARSLAERLRRQVRAAGIPHPDNASGVITVSVGVASVFPTASTTQRELFAMADSALYRAKEAGRDRIEMASAPDG